MPELLIELLSEEIPARMQARAAEDLQRLVTEKLTEAGLAFTQAEAFATPRRLALVVDGVPTEQPEQTEERKGPRVGAPEQAIAGFLKSAGLASLDQCEKRTVGKAEFWFATSRKPGRATARVLPGLLAEAIGALPWAKSMRWGANSFRWVRPLHSVLAVFDGAKLAGAVELGNGRSVTFGDATRGHRFLAPELFAVTGFADYQAKLRAAFVILDAEERERLIVERAEALAARHGLVLNLDPGLLDEVAGLVEWPVPLLGKIDPAFLGLPPEVLTTSMRTHQRYFSLATMDGAFAPYFIVVANIEASDGGAAVVAGNERVLRARLADAKYFWDQDRKTRLEERVPGLDAIVFHAKLGSVGERVARLQTLAGELAEYVPGCDRDRARAAALLCKADLTTGMVGEFPELQGIMGRYYALAEGERADVADAIAEHYAPKGPNDRVPTARVSVALALAEKIDTLVGMFAIGEKPTGSRDPFALRRAALGVIRLVLENRLRVPLRRAFIGADEKVISELLAFVGERLKVHIKGLGGPHDQVAAVFALGDDDLVRIFDRVDELRGFLASDDGANLLVAYRRAANIVRIEEKKDKAAYAGADYDATLAEAEEANLWRALYDAERELPGLTEAERFADAMGALARLRRPVDAFFDRVTVNVADGKLRANRLRLLARIAAVMNRVADFTAIEG